MKYLIFNLKKNQSFKRFNILLIISCLFLYAFSIPAFSGRPVFYVLSYIFIFTLSGSVFLYGFLYGSFKLPLRFFILPLFFAVAAISTIIFSRSYRMLLTVFLVLLTFYVFYYSFRFIGRNRLGLKTIIWAFFTFAIYFIFVYRKQILTLDINQRLGTYFDNVNLIGSYFSISFLLSIYVGLIRQKKAELIYILLAIAFFGCGIFTGSRSFLIVCILLLVCVLFLRFKNHKIIFLVIVALILGLFILLIQLPVFAFLKNQFGRSIYSLFGVSWVQKADTSTIRRLLWQKYAYFLGSKNLLFGYGCNGFAIFSGVGTYAHSNFAEVLCNFGIFGFALFYLPFLLCSALALRSSNKDSRLVIIITIYMVVRGFMSVSYYFKDVYIIFALVYYLVDDVETIFKFGKNSKETCSEDYLYIASLNTEKDKYDGERIKSTYIYNSLTKKIQNLEVVNLSKNKLLGLIRIIIISIFFRDDFKKIIISKDPHGANIIEKIFYVSNVDQKKIIYFEIGPFLYDRILQKKINKKVFENNSVIIVETKSMKDELEELGFRNVDIFPNFKLIPEIERKKYKQQNKLKIIFLSRVEEQKGIYDLVEAVKNVNIENQIVNLDIYGLIADKNDEQRIETISKQINYINYKGKLDLSNIDNYEVLKHYDLHVFPTKYAEGFPGTIIDFFIVGIPTLSSTFKRSKDILNENNSFFFEKGNISSLSNQLIYIYKNQHLLEEKSELTYNERNKYSVEKFEKFLEELINE